MHLLKQPSQPLFKQFVLSALVELAYEVPALPKRIEAERESSETEVLNLRISRPSTVKHQISTMKRILQFKPICNVKMETYHTPHMILERNTSRIHHPAIRIRNAP